MIFFNDVEVLVHAKATFKEFELLLQEKKVVLDKHKRQEYEQVFIAGFVSCAKRIHDLKELKK